MAREKGDKGSDGSGLKATSRRVKDKALKAAADHPLLAEVVAAALVATAAALKDPRKARQLAEVAEDEIGNAGEQVASKGNALWQLALEVARRSLEAVGGAEESGSRAVATSTTKKAKKPRKSNKSPKGAKSDKTSKKKKKS